MNNFEFAMPEKISEVFQYLNFKGSRIKAGGLDLLDLMKEGIISPSRLVNIRNLPQLKFINESEEGLSIGPAVTLSELANSAKIAESYRALAQAAHAIATPQLRNAATIAGNLCQRPRCWYFRKEEFPCLRKGGETCFAHDGEHKYHAIMGNEGDCIIVHPSGTAVSLMALDATLKIVSRKSERSVPIEQFFVTPEQDIQHENILRSDELIAEIAIPATNCSSFYYKQKERQTADWPLAEVAVALELTASKCTKAKVILGSAAPVPWRSTPAEQVLVGHAVTKELARKAADAAMSAAMPLEQSVYKVHIFKAVITRTICWAAGIEPM